MTENEKIFAKLIDKERQTFQATIQSFYSDHEIAKFVPSSAQSPLAFLINKAKKELELPEIGQAEMEITARAIRRSIKAGTPGKVEIQLGKGRQLSDKKPYPLGNSILRITPWDSKGANTSPPFYLFVKEGDTLDASIFLDSEFNMGILAMADEDGDVHFQRLAEFYMFAMSRVEEDEAQSDECAIMTCYHWLLGNVATGILLGNRLDAVKTILMADWLQEEWEKARETKQESSEKEDGCHE